MEKDFTDSGYTLVTSNELLKVGYQEFMRREGNKTERYIVIPQSFHSQKVELPTEISRPESTKVSSGYLIKIPFDSMPLSILDLNNTESISMKYPGLLSNLQNSIEKIKQDNPQLINMLEQYELSLEDMLTVSIEESEINILL